MWIMYGVFIILTPFILYYIHVYTLVDLSYFHVYSNLYNFIL